MLMTLGRWLRSRVVVAIILTSLLAVFLLNGASRYRPQQPVDVQLNPTKYPSQALHLLVPATSSNADLCKLLLSAAILGYPTPILINWGATENKDAYVQHLAKVWTILAYLNKMYKSGQKDDLVLIIDGFDIHFQLPPETIISRYYQENVRANKRIEKQVGEEKAREKGFKQTVIFGHDKLCWPTDWRRPACWMVPEASDPKKAFGPLTDADPGRARARWLNSGTVLGTVGDVRDIFKATLDLIHANHTTDSDQFYFANIWAAQEYMRRLAEDDPFKGVNKDTVDWPEVDKSKRTEYYFGLDYEGVLFQTMAFFREYLTWQTYDGVPATPTKWGGKKTQRHLVSDPYHEKILPDDVALARGPFAAAAAQQAEAPSATQLKNGTLPTHLGWRDLSLGMNAISNQIFPLLHFTGPKEFRRIWWPRLWFIPYAEELLKASVKAPRGPYVTHPIGGKIWWSGEAPGEQHFDFGTKGGSIADNGTFVGWDMLCKAHEPVVFNIGRDGTGELLEKETKKDKKPEGKKEDKPEEKKEDKAEEKKEDKPEEKKEEKPDEKKEDKPDEKKEDKPDEKKEDKPDEKKEDKPEEKPAEQKPEEHKEEQKE